VPIADVQPKSFALDPPSGSMCREKECPLGTVL
jgi:hypothetical protein